MGRVLSKVGMDLGFAPMSAWGRRRRASLNEAAPKIDDRGASEGKYDLKGAHLGVIGAGWWAAVEPFAGAEGERRLRDRRGQSPGGRGTGRDQGQI